MIIPGNDSCLAVGLTPRRLCCVQIARGNHHSKCLERIGDDRTLGRAINERVSTCHKNSNAEVEHDEAHQEGSPEALVLLHEGRRHQRERSQVDAPVEDHVDSLVRDGGINDDAFAALLSLDGHSAALILVGNQRRNVGLDTTRAQSDDDDGDDVSGHAGAVGQSSRQSGGPENNQTNPVEATEDENGLVLSEILVGNNGTENGSDCTWMSDWCRPRMCSKNLP